MATHRLPKRAKELLQKARNAALLGVEIYNKPATPYRSEGFIVQMTIAWTALLHAILEARGVSYYYRQDNGRFQRVDGERKAWELARCMREYLPGQTNALSKNVEFFIGLRNKIEHRFLPSLDGAIAGECQALLLNFETVLEQEFGSGWALMENFFIAVQLSKMRPGKNLEAIKRLQSSLPVNVIEYMAAFRSGLSDEVLNSQEFSFRVFLVPNVANRRESADAAIEFVKYDETDPRQVAELARLGVLIKTKQVEVLNKGGLKPKDVAARVAEGIGRPFSASSHHARAWRYYKVRPSDRAGDPANCDNRYCHYDNAHRDYVYTDVWVKLLIRELSDGNKYQEVCYPRAVAVAAG
ncbi:MAG: DUF3644 domain-containing protein [Actinomycetota bacterium]